MKDATFPDTPLDPDPQVAYVAQKFLEWLRQIRYTHKTGSHRLEIHAKDGNIGGFQTWDGSWNEMPSAIRTRK